MNADELEKKLEHQCRVEERKRYKELKEQAEEQYEDLPEEIYNRLYK